MQLTHIHKTEPFALFNDDHKNEFQNMCLRLFSVYQMHVSHVNDICKLLYINLKKKVAN